MTNIHQQTKVSVTKLLVMTQNLTQQTQLGPYKLLMKQYVMEQKKMAALQKPIPTLQKRLTPYVNNLTDEQMGEMENIAKYIKLTEEVQQLLFKYYTAKNLVKASALPSSPVATSPTKTVNKSTTGSASSVKVTPTKTTNKSITASASSAPTSSSSLTQRLKSDPYFGVFEIKDTKGIVMEWMVATEKAGESSFEERRGLPSRTSRYGLVRRNESGKGIIFSPLRSNEFYNSAIAVLKEVDFKNKNKIVKVPNAKAVVFVKDQVARDVFKKKYNQLYNDTDWFNPYSHTAVECIAFVDPSDKTKRVCVLEITPEGNPFVRLTFALPSEVMERKVYDSMIQKGKQLIIKHIVSPVITIITKWIAQIMKVNKMKQPGSKGFVDKIYMSEVRKIHGMNKQLKEQEKNLTKQLKGILAYLERFFGEGLGGLQRVISGMNHSAIGKLFEKNKPAIQFFENAAKPFLEKINAEEEARSAAMMSAPYGPYDDAASMAAHSAYSAAPTMAASSGPSTAIAMAASSGPRLKDPLLDEENDEDASSGARILPKLSGPYDHAAVMDAMMPASSGAARAPSEVLPGTFGQLALPGKVDKHGHYHSDSEDEDDDDEVSGSGGGNGGGVYIPEDEEERKEGKFGRSRKLSKEAFVKKYCKKKNCSREFALKKYHHALRVMIL